MKRCNTLRQSGIPCDSSPVEDVSICYWIYYLKNIFTSKTVNLYFEGSIVFHLGHCVGVRLLTVVQPDALRDVSTTTLMKPVQGKKMSLNLNCPLACFVIATTVSADVP